MDRSEIILYNEFNTWEEKGMFNNIPNNFIGLVLFFIFLFAVLCVLSFTIRILLPTAIIIIAAYIVYMFFKKISEKN